MIKRWTIHLEFHRGYRPRFYIHRQARPGERHVDGGVPGTLIACPECSGQGLLHQPDNAPGAYPEPPVPITNAPKYDRLDLGTRDVYPSVGQTIFRYGRDYIVKDIVSATAILERKDDSPHIPPDRC